MKKTNTPKREPRERVRVWMPKELALEIKRCAAAEKSTVSAYCRKIAAAAVS